MIPTHTRVTLALEYAKDGQVDGEHHKAWAIDQMVRALTGCPTITKTAYADGRPYTYLAQGESEEYLGFIDEYKAGEDGPETYSWEEGIAP